MANVEQQHFSRRLGNSMVINDRYGFIFVHIPKSAGTSIALTLRSLDGNNRHVLSRTTKHETLAELLAAWKERVIEGDQARGRLPREYFTFAYVRNPWDRMFSLYCNLREKRYRPEIDGVASFEDFLARAFDRETWIQSLHSIKPQATFVQEVVGGPVAADFVGHYEHLNTDFATAMRLVGVEPMALPRTNSSANASLDYRSEFSTRMVDIVAELFAEDLITFSYSFEDSPPARRHREVPV